MSRSAGFTNASATIMTSYSRNTIDAGSPESLVGGVTLVPQIEHGQLTLMVMPRARFLQVPALVNGPGLDRRRRVPVGDLRVAPGD